MQAIVLGQLQLAVLDDGAFPFPMREFFSNVAEPAWRQYVPADEEGKAPVGHNCALVRSAKELIVIDTGYGDDTHGGRTGHMLAELARTGYRRGDVTMVVLTHAHGDHCGRNTMVLKGVRRPAFPNAAYFLGRRDWDWFSGQRGEMHHFAQNFQALADAGVLRLVDGEVQLTPEVRLIQTPGHTPGHMSVLMESRGESAIYLGDLCHHPVQVEHPEWVSSFDTDPQVTRESRARIFAMAAQKDALVICPHAKYPGMGRVRRVAGGYAWEAADGASNGG